MTDTAKRAAFIAKQINKCIAETLNQENRIAEYVSELRSMQMTAGELQQSGLVKATNQLRRFAATKATRSVARELLQGWGEEVDDCKSTVDAAVVKEKRGKRRRKVEASGTDTELGTQIGTGDASNGDRNETKRRKLKARKEGEHKGRGEEVKRKEKQEPKAALSAKASSEKQLKQEQQQKTKTKTEETAASAEAAESDDSSLCDLRLRCRQMIESALTEAAGSSSSSSSRSSSSSKLTPSQLSRRIEAHIFQEFNSTDSKYRNRIRSRLQNLRDAKNPQLRQLLLEGQLSPQQFASMSAEQLASDEMRQLRDRLAKEAIDDYKMAVALPGSSSLFSCKRCKRNSCTYHQLQTLSGDEPMTTYVFCNECGFRWKFN